MIYNAVLFIYVNIFTLSINIRFKIRVLSWYQLQVYIYNTPEVYIGNLKF